MTGPSTNIGVAPAADAGAIARCAVCPHLPWKRIHLSTEGIVATDAVMAHTLSTYVLDTALGRPARAMDVTLERMNDDGVATIGGGTTNAEGRITSLATSTVLTPGTYRMRFDTEGYFTASGRDTFYPEVAIHFRIGKGAEHYHVPLHVSPFGYSTSREA